MTDASAGRRSVHDDQRPHGSASGGTAAPALSRPRLEHRPLRADLFHHAAGGHDVLGLADLRRVRTSREPFQWLLSGLPFAATLLAILVVHEFGH